MKKYLLMALFGMTLFSLNAQLNVVSSGKVGIATPTPFSTLHVVGNITFTQTTSSITSAAYIRGLNSYSAATTPDYTWYNNDQTGIFHPGSNTIGFSTSGIERVRINSSGNVGIGTTSPERLLTVGGASNPVIGYKTLDGKGWASYAHNNLNFSIFEFTNTAWSSGFDRFTILRGGNIGIGNSSPANILDVYGYSVLFDFTNRPLKFLFGAIDPRICSDYKVVFYKTDQSGFIDIECQVLYEHSSINDKKDIKSLTNCLEKVLLLEGVNFIWKNDSTNKLNAGLIAQDVEKVIPEVVITVDSTDDKLISYNKIIPYLIEAIKIQQTELESIKNELINSKKSIVLGSSEYKPDFSNCFLFQNSPNPFNENTLIKYIVPSFQIKAMINIYDLQGKQVESFNISQTGKGEITITSSLLTPGIYIYNLIVDGNEVDSKRMILTE